MRAWNRFAVLAVLATLFVTAGALPASARTVTPVQEVPTTSELRGVACASATVCYAVGVVAPGFAVMVPIVNGVAGTAQRLPGPSSSFEVVGCESATTCYAVGSQLVPRPGQRPGSQGIVVSITNGVLGALQGYPNLNVASVSCADGTCYALGSSVAAGPALYRIVNGALGAAQPVGGIQDVSSLTCASASTCYVLGGNVGDFDSEGVLVPVVDGVVGAPQTVPGIWGFSGMACSSATTCTVLGQGGFDLNLQPVVIPFANGVLGDPVVVPGVGGLSGIACASATLCEAVGFGDGQSLVGALIVPIVSGVPGTPEAVPQANGFYDIACASAATCVATGLTLAFPFKGVVVVINESATEASACKNGGFKLFRDPAFKNQGACVSAVQSGGRRA